MNSATMIRWSDGGPFVLGYEIGLLRTVGGARFER